MEVLKTLAVALRSVVVVGLCLSFYFLLQYARVFILLYAGLFFLLTDARLVAVARGAAECWACVTHRGDT